MEQLKTLNDFIALVEFLDEDITPSISERILSEAKSKLPKHQILALGESALTSGAAEAASLYTLISEYDGEMGGLAHY